jgi:hypothetical protein
MSPVDQAFRTSRILHAALVGSLMLYAVVVHVLQAALDWLGTLPSGSLAIARPLLFGRGAAMTVVVLVSRRPPTSTSRLSVSPERDRPYVLGRRHPGIARPERHRAASRGPPSPAARRKSRKAWQRGERERPVWVTT